MQWATGIMVYMVIWWTVIFAVLPIGVWRVENPTRGVEPGAPESPQLLRKAAITTAISTVLWLIWLAAWVFDVFGLRPA